MKRTLGWFSPDTLAATFAAAMLTVGCGGNASQSPTGPSGISGSASGSLAVTAAGEETASTLAKGGAGKGKGDLHGPEHGKKPEDDVQHGRSHEARVVGFVTSVAGGTLTINGIDVVGATDVVVRHGQTILTIADIEVGDHVQARGKMEGSVLVATEIKVEDTGEGSDGFSKVKIEGAISGLSSTATCPAVTFTLGTTQVTTSAATVFDDVTCAALANNTVVKVKGTRQADGSVLATSVEADDDEFEADDDEAEGFVFEFSGAASCPAATFKVGPTLALATVVKTTASTTFSDVTCATLANGLRVEVEGTKQADGAIIAASVELD